MLVYRLSKKNEVDSNVSAEAADAQMVGRMRLVLAVSAFLAFFIDHSGFRGGGVFTWLVFSGYIAYSLAVCVYSQLGIRLSRSKLIHWADVFWYALIVFLTDGVQSFFFLFFLFAILTSSFRWGFEEGARVTIASAALFAACGVGSATEDDLARLLMRTTFLLTLGYMCVHWGGSKVELKRRLALLREVSRLSNPRFGVGHTITSVLEQTRSFFGATSCILVLRDKESAAYTLRTIKEGNSPGSINAERISVEAALPLMALPKNHLVTCSRPAWHPLTQAGRTTVYDSEKNVWIKNQGRAGDQLAELLNAPSFISAPLSLRKSEGRIYVLSQQTGFRKADVLFLSHIVAQAFPVIENIELLDRMASDAALQERQKLALDIHDTAIQPYIGLKLGLSALRNKASADNPLVPDLEKLEEMAAEVITDLRRYAGTVKNGLDRTQQMFLAVLHQQVEQVRDFYGVDITVRMDEKLELSDRLAAEVLQIVREGLTNICKHTLAHRGFVTLYCANGLLEIQIENEGSATDPVDFRPKSIFERASALGGSAQVKRGLCGSTAIHIEIPI